MLPAAIRDWAPALALWPELDEHRYQLVVATLGDGTADDWETFLTSAEATRLLEDAPVGGRRIVRTEWLPALERDLAQLGGADAVRLRLLDHWLGDPDPRLAADMVRWACDLRQWQAVLVGWIRLNELGEEFAPDVLRRLAELPVEARVEQPVLSWTIGAVTAVLADAKDPAAATMPHGMLQDAALLHANWSLREDTDLAVQAGTLRMLGQRRQPSARAGASLEAAWRTKEELDAFIDARSRQGLGPDRISQGLFRAFSAQLALFRGDPGAAINEARWAALITDRAPLRVLAHGVEALALSVSNADGPEHYSDPPVERISDPLGNRGMRGLGESFEILADANAALRRLDREEVDRALALVSPADAAFGGVWAMRTALEAFRDAYWGDLTTGIDRLASEIARQSRAGREQDEPMGGAVLGRARTLLLVKSGAFTSASYSIEALPAELKFLPQARIHLWAGQFEQAIRVADSGAYEDGRGLVDRSMLKIVKAAAALLNGSCNAEFAADAVREIRHVIATRNFVAIAALPQSARSALLELCAPELAGDPDYELLLARLAGLNDSGERGVRPLRLTEREKILLPLLASDERVPEIARKLQVSVNTVRKQVVTLREKFQAGTRAELIRKARNYGAIN